jgi:uncharacterized protein DUF6882
MDAPDWYDAWCEDAFEAFTAKQKQLNETYQLGSWHRYDYDAAAGVLTFSDKEAPRVIADMQIVGTIGERDWMWGWANSHWPAVSTESMRRVHAFGVEHGIDELTTEYLESDDLGGLGWMLTAIAARVLDAEGAYRAPSGTGALYMVLRSLKFVS